MKSSAKAIDIPIGRIELFGLVLHIMEQQGRLVAVCTDEEGGVVVPLSTPGISARSCRRLMQSAVDLLLDAAERAFCESPSDTAPRSTCCIVRTSCGLMK